MISFKAINDNINGTEFIKNEEIRSKLSCKNLDSWLELPFLLFRYVFPTVFTSVSVIFISLNFIT